MAIDYDRCRRLTSISIHRQRQLLPLLLLTENFMVMFIYEAMQSRFIELKFRRASRCARKQRSANTNKIRLYGNDVILRRQKM
jgi:hypothetical protein